MADKYDKIILAVARKHLFGEDNKDAFQGFKPSHEIDYNSRINQNFQWMRRGDIENNPDIKHPIGYTFIVNPEKGKVFVYQRAGAHNESRLAGKWSGGIGGHIEQQDNSSNDPIKDSTLREFDEEVKVIGETKRQHHVLGYINDDSNSVGEVHLGVLNLILTNATNVTPRQGEMAKGHLMDFFELEKMCKAENVETWTSIAVPYIKEFLENHKS
ncbi:hypothetical protein GF386_06545 [Candidatus Pacearchaeota archaeon]|nr:hypothetical protein [Candidatus Pacearchaeota archaeon]MBD3283751.1 hypothetical protein [Candidatus Pacearchaeota archaeon]